jgi:hypothetical protein
LQPRSTAFLPQCLSPLLTLDTASGGAAATVGHRLNLRLLLQQYQWQAGQSWIDGVNRTLASLPIFLAFLDTNLSYPHLFFFFEKIYLILISQCRTQQLQPSPRFF